MIKFETGKPFFLDGSMGANLIAAGMPREGCAEIWLTAHPEVFTRLLAEYERAGSGAVYAPTFETAPAKLARYGLAERAYELNSTLVRLAKEAVKCAVLGDISPSGLFARPSGEATMEALIENYTPQVRAFADADAAGAAIETQMTAADFRAAALCCKKYKLPFLITITVGGGGRTLSGCSLPCAAIIAGGLGAFAVGLNCSSGPESMAAPLRAGFEVSRLPLIAKPNAGLPDSEGKYSMAPEEFGRQTAALVGAGAAVLGGCCGTAPAHIAQLVKNAGGLKAPAPAGEGKYLCTENRFVKVTAQTNISAPIAACEDLPELAAASGADACTVSIKERAQLEAFIDAAPLLPVPAVLTGEAELVKTALLYYNGIAGLAMRTDGGVSAELSESYGCLIL